MLGERQLASVPRALADEAMEATCQACDAKGMTAFYEVKGVPTQTCVLLDESESASGYPTGEVLLAFCEECGFVQNVRFDLSIVDYSKPTEESQAFSPLFTEFANGLVDEMMSRYDLVGKTAFEVGCGKGDFLLLLAEHGLAYGLGIDPGYLPERIQRDDASLEFRREWYDAGSTTLTGDLVLTRHLMEHVPNVGEFFGWLRESTLRTEGAALFTEVPDVSRVLAEGAYWDVYYEHCSYFTLGSLARTLRRVGFDIDFLRLGFQDQYLLAGARPGSGEGAPESVEESVEQVGAMIESFATRASESVTRWRSRIDSILSGGGNVAIWGGASKAVAFISSIGITDVTVVDINPYRQEKWLPGIAVEVESPEVLRERNPSLVIPMNPIYLDEIGRDLKAMGLEPELEAVTPA